MIIANELRIGNWYNHNGEFKQATPNTILEVWEADRIWVMPIPLTPEILERAGFEFYTYCDCWVIETTTGEIILSDKYILQSTDSITQLYFLHQLQNLFFALTGEELKIEL